VSLQRLRITGGNGPQGGGIFNDGTLTIESCTVTNNITGGSGGGIHNEGSLTATDLIVSDNLTAIGGGGISNTQTLELQESLLARNTASSGGRGGGILNSGDGSVILTNCDVIQNHATFMPGGGGIYDEGVEVVLTDGVVVGNTPDDCARDGVVVSCGA
jgi:hypothetical protein